MIKVTSEKELLRVEKEFAEAIVKNDLEGIERLVADDWIIIGPDGEIVERARFFEVIESGDMTHDTMESEDFRMRVYADSAVVIGITRTKGKFMGRSSARRNEPPMFLLIAMGDGNAC